MPTDVRDMFVRATLFVVAVVGLVVGVDRVAGRWLPAIPGYALADPVPVDGDVLIFGSSVLKWVETEKENGTAILDGLRKALPGCVVREWSGLAYSARDFEAALHGLRDWGRVRLVVVPVALRSLGPSWGLNPEYERPRQRQFQNAAVPILVRYLAVLGYPFRKTRTQEEYRSLPVIRDGRPVSQVGTCFDIRSVSAELSEPEQARLIRDKLQFYYLADVDETNPELQALKGIAMLCAGHGVKVLIYVEPVNVTRISKYDGDAGLEKVRRNVCSVSAVVTGMPNVLFYDGSFLLEGSEEAFSMPGGLTDEHVTLRWRDRVSLSIADRIRRALEGEAIGAVGREVATPGATGGGA